MPSMIIETHEAVTKAWSSRLDAFVRVSDNGAPRFGLRVGPVGGAIGRALAGEAVGALTDGRQGRGWGMAFGGSRVVPPCDTLVAISARSDSGYVTSL